METSEFLGPCKGRGSKITDFGWGVEGLGSGVTCGKMGLQGVGRWVRSFQPVAPRSPAPSRPRLAEFAGA